MMFDLSKEDIGRVNGIVSSLDDFDVSAMVDMVNKRRAASERTAEINRILKNSMSEEDINEFAQRENEILKKKDDLSSILYDSQHRLEEIDRELQMQEQIRDKAMQILKSNAQNAVHNIVGFGKAAEIALRDLKENEAHIKSLDDMLIAGISAIDGIHTTVDAAKRLPGIVSLVVDKSDFHNERFIKKISEDIALSTGSACSAGEPSYVIQALGLANEVTKVLRVSINKYTTEDDINSFLSLLKTI